MKYALRELAELVGGQLQGHGELEITGAATLRNATPGDISLVEGAGYLASWRECRATAVVAPPGTLPLDAPAILAGDPKVAFERIVQHLRPLPQDHTQGVSPAAAVHPTVQLGRNVTIHPLAVLGEHVTVGDNTTIHSGCVLLAGSTVGSDCTLFPNVVLYEGTRVGNRVLIHAGVVLGAYGFGYGQVDGRHIRCAQMGHVEVHDDVEIGAGSTIDRGSYDATVIGEGTKIDNQVMIGHNCRIGRHNLLCAQVGIAGSVRLGDYVVLAGQVGVKDHVDLADGARVGAKSGVHSDIPAGATYFGIPAYPAKEQRQAMVSATRIPEMRRQLRALERTVRQLQAQLEAPGDDRSAESEAA